jgi:hypothetical protein
MLKLAIALFIKEKLRSPYIPFSNASVIPGTRKASHISNKRRETIVSGV